VYAYGSSPPAGMNHDSTARSPRTPWIRPPPCASHTSRRPRPKRPRCPSYLGRDPERAEAPIDEVGVDALAVVGADELVLPAAQGGQAQGAQRRPPRPQELRIGGPDPEVDATSLAPGGGDRRVGVRHELGDDLGEIDPGLREVLAEVASADATLAELCRVDRPCHGRRIELPRCSASATSFARPAVDFQSWWR
jgi:hypothetical protein